MMPNSDGVFDIEISADVWIEMMPNSADISASAVIGRCPLKSVQTNADIVCWVNAQVTDGDAFW